MRSTLSRYLPYRLKRFLKALSSKEIASTVGLFQHDSYEERIAQEKQHYLEKYQDRVEDEPLFERAPASWGYVERATESLIREKLGCSQWEYIVQYANQIKSPEMLSLGSGPCGIEISLVEKITSDYHCHCVDLNEQVLEIGRRQIEKKGLNITVEAMDLNFITLEAEKYDVITAFAALHHLHELEKIYAAVNNALKPNGIFVTVDVITRNGLMMWPETHEIVKQLWSVWPNRYKFSHTAYATPRFVSEYRNVDYGKGSFEAIRSQDVLPLIPEYFDAIAFVPYHTISRRFLDTQFGPNYDLNDPFDYRMVEFIWNLDCYYLRERVLPPETMFAVMRKKGTADPRIVEDVTARMLADSRAKQNKWVAPAHLRRLSYSLDTSDNELLANPQFEILENGLPLSWFVYGNPRIDTSGVQSALGKVVVQADENSGLYQAVSVAAKKRYLLCHITRADKKGQLVRLQVNWHNVNGDFIKTDIELLEAEAEWKENEMLVFAPPRAEQAFIYVSAHENSQVWFDSISFVEVTKELPTSSWVWSSIAGDHTSPVRKNLVP